MIYGTIAAAGSGIEPKSTYSIDGGPITNYTGIQEDDTVYRQLFFDSGTLSTQQDHTITIESLVDDGRFFLDFVVIYTSFSTSPNSSELSSTPISISSTPSPSTQPG